MRPAFVFLLGNAFGERPSKMGRLSTSEGIPNGAGGLAAISGNLADREVVLMFERKDLDDLTHSDGF